MISTRASARAWGGRGGRNLRVVALVEAGPELGWFEVVQLVVADSVVHRGPALLQHLPRPLERRVRLGNRKIQS